MGLSGLFYALDLDGNPFEVERPALGFLGLRMAWTGNENGVHVSTVFLGIDHGFGFGPPVLFETMVFGNSNILEQRRASTLAEAIAWHQSRVGKYLHLMGENCKTELHPYAKNLATAATEKE